MLLMLAALLLGQSEAATPGVSEARAKAVVRLGIATGSLAFTSSSRPTCASPPEVQSARGCERAKDDVQSARMKAQEVTDPDVKPEQMAAALEQARAQLQVEPGTDAKLSSQLPGSA
jgi:hypothetical protein